MPIARDKLALYPGGSIRSNAWRAIRGGVLARAGNRCEGTPQRPNCRAANGLPHPETGSFVVLTIAHMDRDLVDHTDADLRALCQLCHNRWDQAARTRSAIDTRARKLGEGTLDLLCERRLRPEEGME